MLKSDSAGYLYTYRCFWWSIDFESSRMIICEFFFLLVLNMSLFNNFAESWGLGDIFCLTEDWLLRTQFEWITVKLCFNNQLHEMWNDMFVGKIEVSSTIDL